MKLRRSGAAIAAVFAVLLLALVSANVTAWAAAAAAFYPPHTADASRASLNPALRKALREALVTTHPAITKQVLRFALEQTDKHLHFGLSHKTSFTFTPIEREGNCIEYAHLFARIFNDAASASKVSAKAYAVHSGGARFLGFQVPLRGFNDHDWNLIVERDDRGKETRRLFVDPTFADVGLDWNIEQSVRGKVEIVARDRNH